MLRIIFVFALQPPENKYLPICTHIIYNIYCTVIFGDKIVACFWIENIDDLTKPFSRIIWFHVN